MGEKTEFVLRVLTIGIGATIIMDLWNFAAKTVWDSIIEFCFSRTLDRPPV